MHDAIKVGIINILIVVLCLGMVGAGALKLMSYVDVVSAFEQWGFPTWFRYMIGAIEFIIGLCIFIPATRKYALWALIILMHGAAFTHIAYGQYWDIRGPIMVILSATATLYLQETIGRKPKMSA